MKHPVFIFILFIVFEDHILINFDLFADPPTFAEASDVQRDDKQSIPYVPMYPMFKN